MDTQTFSRAIRANWLVVLLIMLAAVGAGYFVTAQQTPQYTSQTTLLYEARVNGAVSQQLQGATLAAQRAMRDSVVAATTAQIVPVMDELGVTGITAKALADAVTATVNETFLTIEVTTTDPLISAQIANALGARLAGTANAEQYDLDESAETAAIYPFHVTQVQEATVAESPSSPNLLLNLAISVALGLAVAFVVLLLRARADQRIMSQDALPAETPVLGTVTASRRRDVSKRFGASVVSREIAQLRTVLTAESGHSHLVVAVSQGQAALDVATRLAHSFAATGASTLLVEADLRNPRLAEVLGLTQPLGLADLLDGRVLPSDSGLYATAGSLDILSAGSSREDASELFASAHGVEVFAEIRARLDRTVIFAPALAQAADALVLAPIVGRIVLLVERGRTGAAELDAAVTALSNVGVSVGIVWVLESRRSPRTPARSTPVPVVERSPGMVEHAQR